MTSASNQYASYVVDRVRARCRRDGYSEGTMSRYLYWIRRFVEGCDVSAPQDLRAETAQSFLQTLSGCAHSTKKQARNALHFLFDTVSVTSISEAAGPMFETGNEPPVAVPNAGLRNRPAPASSRLGGASAGSGPVERGPNRPRPHVGRHDPGTVSSRQGRRA